MNFNDNKIHFSKVIIILCLIFAILTCAVAVIFPLQDTVAIALIAAGGGIASTAVVFNLKKSQAENTLKIYMTAYEHILNLKHQYSIDGIQNEADDAAENIENKLLNKIDQSFDEHMDNATSILEKQEIGVG